MWKTPLRFPLRLLLGCLVLLAIAAGCDDDKTQPAPGASGSAAPGAPQAVEKALVDLSAPADVLAFGGADNLEKFLEEAQKMAAQISPMAAAPLAMTKTMTEGLRLTNADAIDLKKASRFVIIDPKKHSEPFAMIVGTAGKDKLVAALPADKKENDEGNAYSWKTKNDKVAYLNFIDDFAVLSPSKDIFPASKGFLAELAKAKLPSPVAVVGAVQNIMALYGTDLDAAIKQAKAELEQASKMAPPGSPGATQPSQVAAVGAMFDWFSTTVKELDKALVVATLPSDGFLVSLTLKPKKGTELEKTFKALGQRPLDLLAKLPADSPGFFAMNIDPESTGELTKKLVSWSLTMGMGAGNVPEKYMAAMTDYWKATNGQFVLAVHKALQGPGMAMTGLMGLRDAAKAREAMKTVSEMYKEPSVAEMYKGLGMTIEYKEEAYKVGDVPVATQQVKMGPMLKALGPIGAMLEDLMTTHVAHGPEIGVVAYGKDGKGAVEAYLGGQAPGGLDKAPGVTRAMKNAAPGAFAIGYLAPVDIVKGIHFGGQNPFAAQLGEVPAATSGIAISIGAKDGDVLVTADVPVEQAKAVAQLAVMAQSM